MAGQNRLVISENVLKGESALNKALDDANSEAIKIESKGKKEKK